MPEILARLPGLVGDERGDMGLSVIGSIDLVLLIGGGDVLLYVVPFRRADRPWRRPSGSSIDVFGCWSDCLGIENDART